MVQVAVQAAVRLRFESNVTLLTYKPLQLLSGLKNHIKYFLSCQAAVRTASVCLDHKDVSVGDIMIYAL